jgi:hypothetical protein
MTGINVWAGLVQTTTFTFLNFYQYTSAIELAIFDVTPKIQLALKRIDQALLLMQPFDFNIMIWVDYLFLGWSIAHQNGANLPITSMLSWVQQLFTGGTEYFPFAWSDLVYYGNQSYYIDPFLSGDLSTLPDWLVAWLLPQLGGHIIP